MLHVLEHIQDPKEFIVNCLSALTPKGKLLIELPNIEEPLINLYHNSAFYNFYWRPDHLFFYEPITISLILFFIKYFYTEIGDIEYRVIRKQRYGIINHLNWLLRHKPTNINWHIPILDSIYKYILCATHHSDTMWIIIEKTTERKCYEVK